MTAQVTTPFAVFSDVDGRPLEDGYVWIGLANADPQASPAQVYWNEALTLPAAQPIRTKGGYPANAGTAGNLFISAAAYSIRVQNKRGAQVFLDLDSRPSGGGVQGLDDIPYLAQGVGATGGDSFGQQYRANNPVFVWDFLTEADRTSLAATLGTGSYTAGNMQYAVDAALTRARAIAVPWVHFPPGNMTLTCVAITDEGLFNSFKITGCGTATRLRGAGAVADANKSVLKIVGVSAFATFGSFSDFVIDTTNIPDVATNCGIFMQKAFNMDFQRVHVLATGSAKRTVLMKTSASAGSGVYTTSFSQCDLGSTAGIVELTGTSLGDAITTVSFVNQTGFAALRCNFCVGITCAAAVVQGNLQKFYIRNTLGFTCRDSDIEGNIPTQTILGAPARIVFDTDSTVNSLEAAGNAFNGISGSYTLLSPDPLSAPFAYSLNEYLNDGQQFRNPQGFLFNATARTAHRFRSSNAAGNRLYVESSAATGDADMHCNAGAGRDAFFGVTRAGITYIDARGGSGALMYISGTPRLGVGATNRLMIDTGTSTTATAGTSGALPAQAAGYYEVVNSAGTVVAKIPYFAP